jgi:hypothetical protein
MEAMGGSFIGRCWAVSLLASAGFSQTIVDPKQIQPNLREFTPAPNEPNFKCDVSPIKPALNFSFRFQAGYVLRVPMKQFVGPGHSWAILMRVTPQEGTGEPVYLAAAQRLPVVPENKLTAEFAGGFLVGEGRYTVDWAMVDEAGRTCRKQWRIHAKPGRSERDIRPAMAPGTVDDISLRRSGRPLAGSRNAASDQRVTILLHAAPLFPGRVRMRSYDRILLLSSLATLADRLPDAAIRVIAFNLDQQKELFRVENFDRRAFRSLSRVLSDIELGLVDYNILKNRKGHLDLLTDLVTDEIIAAPAADAVIILGPPTRHADKVPKSMLQEKDSDHPRFFFFRYSPYRLRGAELPDSLAFAMRRIGGKTTVIRTPGDFGKAIEQVQAVVASSN